MKIFLYLAVLLSGLCVAPITTAQDRIFRSGLEQPSDLPANRNAAARFLTQATFGPNEQDINRVMALGYRGWIEEQIALPATVGRAAVEQIIDAKIAAGEPYSQRTRYNQWAKQAIYAPDQLRQRMAFALSQIFVVSDQPSNLSYDVIQLTDFYDNLALDGFGLFRKLLGDVTYHPSMGKYLSSMKNRSATATSQPDENFAREIMQLFSVGLIERNLNYTPILNGSGSTVPTYDQNVVTNTAKVFTGFTYIDTPTDAAWKFALWGPESNYGARAPMACWGTELFGPTDPRMMHDITGNDGTTSTPKIVIGGLTIPASQTCAQDVSTMLNILASHNNTAPFISYQLIQRFVTSNPSPAYVQRVASVFVNNGENVRGDLGAVITAILLDPEARNPPLLIAGDGYGKLREPLLRLTALWRAWNAVPTAPDAWGEVRLTANLDLPRQYGQGPMSAPSVFNFYRPDYQPPGVFTTKVVMHRNSRSSRRQRSTARPTPIRSILTVISRIQTRRLEIARLSTCRRSSTISTTRPWCSI